MKKKQIISILLSIIILLYLFNSVDINKTLEAIQNANQIYILITGLSAIVLLLLRTMVWGLFLEPYKINMKKRHVLSTFLASQLLANVTPGRIGEISRPLFLKKRYGGSFFNVLPSIIIERFLDVAILSVFCMSLLFLISGSLNLIISAILTFTIIIFGITLAVVLDRRLLRLFSRGVLSLIPSKRASKLLDKIEILMDNFYLGVKKLKSAKLMQIILLMFVGWLISGLILYVTALSILPATELPPVELFFGFMALAILGGTLSSLPGGLGPTDAIIFLLLNSFGIAEPISLSITLLYRFAAYVIPILFCAYFFYIEVKN